jgi:hypothetical protein
MLASYSFSTRYTNRSTTAHASGCPPPPPTRASSKLFALEGVPNPRIPKVWASGKPQNTQRFLLTLRLISNIMLTLE